VVLSKAQSQLSEMIRRDRDQSLRDSLVVAMKRLHIPPARPFSQRGA